jgi:GNAT superfamily N-acetyltransferase
VSQKLVGFSAWVKALNKPGYREHRTVVLPPWQGMGVGQALANWSASLLAGLGQPVWSTTGHPALVAARLRSTQWRQTRPMGLVHAEVGKTHATCRLTAGFRFQGQPMQANRARAILDRKTKCQTASPPQA